MEGWISTGKLTKHPSTLYGAGAGAHTHLQEHRKQQVENVLCERAARHGRVIKSSPKKLIPVSGQEEVSNKR